MKLASMNGFISLVWVCNRNQALANFGIAKSALLHSKGQSYLPYDGKANNDPKITFFFYNEFGLDFFGTNNISLLG